MAPTILSSFEFSGTTVRYLLDAETKRVGFQMVPTAMVGQIVEHRERATTYPEFQGPMLPGPIAALLDPLVHIKLKGSRYASPFSNGRTMRSAWDAESLKYDSQQVEQARDDAGEKTIITTVLKHPDGHTVKHQLMWYAGARAGDVMCSFTNGTDAPVTLEFITSFAMSGITPFTNDDAPERLRLHRFRSNWSAEGRHEDRLFEDLHLERSWSGSGATVERFGELGSMPVRVYFPFVAVEDAQSHVLWGAQLYWAASWQMEVGHAHDYVTLDGGLADREFGHWFKNIAPKETFVAPKAIIACAAGDIDDLCDALTQTQQHAADQQPAVEKNLPVVCNEWCTTWGVPTHESVVAMADRLKGTGVKYLVIDAGWYRPDAGVWYSGHGDWVTNKKAFPNGLAATTAAIRERGLIPGLWFEIETCGSESQASQKKDLLLQLDGKPLQVGARFFWDLSNPRAVEYLAERVIGQLESAGFGYLKVDYNDAIGIGVDGCESPGEGLRKQTEAMYAWYHLMRKRMPNLVIEICASGGHRLEPSMLAIGAQASFSDAHECREIPIIAANLHRLMLPRQSQIWAVLHKGDSDARLVYSLAGGFLGRLCLSGEIHDLSPAQWATTLRAVKMYDSIAPIIRDGRSRRQGETSASWRRARGWQAVVRTSGNRSLIVAHTFEGHSGDVKVKLPAGDWKIADSLHTLSAPPTVAGGALILAGMGEFHGAVVVMEKA